MTQMPLDAETVLQLFPATKRVALAGLYLEQGLARTAEKLGRILMITNFIMDRQGVIAKTNRHNQLQVPVEIKNASDWRLFQELLAQADVMISSSSYLRRAAAAGSQAQNVLSQFEQGGDFEDLGAWRLANGFARRSPDLAVITRGMNFQIPDQLIHSNRRIIVFTPEDTARSSAAQALTASGVVVVGCGAAGVDGSQLVDWLEREGGYRVGMLSAGPAALQLFLAAQRLDYFYVTEVQREIPLDEPAAGQTLLAGGKKVGELHEFQLAQQVLQEDARADDGAPIQQIFYRYDRQGIWGNQRRGERGHHPPVAGELPSR